MPKKFFTLFIGILFISLGCSSVNKKYYVEIKDREDQDLYGNSGYLMGTPPEGYQTGFKKTRKVYVLEMTKKPEDEKIEEPAAAALGEESTDTAAQESSVMSAAPVEPTVDPVLAEKIADLSREDEPVHEETPPKITLTEEERREILKTNQDEELSAFNSAVEETAAIDSGIQLPTEYTVQEKDTLQTIAKKFYNSYRKWPAVYEANKDKLSDPNKIKKGMVLTIPAL